MKKNLVMILALVVVAVLAITAAAFGDSIVPGSEDDPVVSKSYVDGKTTFVPVQVAAGKSVIGGEGTEIILRSGEAKAVGNAANGISDVTDGKDLMTGYWVYQNHLLLVPRADGRGIIASTDIWIMVKGDYNIQ